MQLNVILLHTFFLQLFLFILYIAPRFGSQWASVSETDITQNYMTILDLFILLYMDFFVTKIIICILMVMVTSSVPSEKGSKIKLYKI